MANRTPPTSINKLTTINQFKLMQIVQSDYASSKLSDREFAEHATKALGFLVTSGNIQGCREALDIQSNKMAIAAEKAKPKNRLEEIEARISRLEALAKELGWKI